MKNLDKYHMVIISVCIGGIVLLIYTNHNWSRQGKNLFDESVVSFLAFTLLIITALMQNRDLRLQREEMQMTREELSGSKEAQEQQKEELMKSNALVSQNIKQTQFFELLRLKEEIILSKEINFTLINKKIKRDIFINIIEQLTYEERNNLLDLLTKLMGEVLVDTAVIENRNKNNSYKELIEKIISINNMNLVLSDYGIKTIFDKYYKKAYFDILNEQPSTYFKLHNINETISELISDKNVKGQIENIIESYTAPIEAMMSETRIAFGLGYTKDDLTENDIHNKLLVKGEKEFYKLLSMNYKLDDMVDKEEN